MQRLNTLVLVGVAAATTSAALVTRAPQDGISGKEHIVERDGQSIYLWERWDPAHLEGAVEKGQVVLFLHGATWSGRPDFDLDVKDASTMKAFARDGWDAYCVDIQGYGKSDDPAGEGRSEAKDAVLDVEAAVDFIVKHRDVEKVHLVGWSWGSQVAGLFAQTYPGKVERLVLYGTRYAAFEDPDAPPLARFRTNSLEDTRTDFIEGCFDPDVVDAFSTAALLADPDSPNGIWTDYLVNLPILDPDRLDLPVMIVAGEHEAVDTIDDITQLLREIPSPDKRLVVIPGGGHAVHLERGRSRWNRAVMEFLGSR